MGDFKYFVLLQNNNGETKRLCFVCRQFKKTEQAGLWLDCDFELISS